jgi:cytochrome c5
MATIKVLYDEATKHVLTVVVAALMILATAQDATAQKAERSGKEVVESLCVSCHGTGAGGAPKIGDKKAWSKLASRGLSGLSKSALNGIRGMPPHGGNPNLSDTEIERAITYMVNQSGGHWAEPVSRTSRTTERTGEQIVSVRCSHCHRTGVNGAPKIGNKADWIARLKPGLDVVVRSAINGHGGMPPRGGMADLTDAEIRSAIVYMFNPVTVPAPKSSVASAATRQDFAVVDGTTVYFGVVSADVIRKHPKDYPPRVYGVAPAGPAQYYVTVALFDTPNGQRIDDAVVKARVSTTMEASPEKTLEPITIANSRGYGNYFAMAGAGPYKITVHVRRPGASDVIQAQFEYTHQ